MNAEQITIAVTDHREAQGASPSRVRLQILRDFSDEVTQLLKGHDKDVDPDRLHVGVEQGSLAIATEPFLIPDRLLSDLSSLLESQILDAIDVKRREVILRWQKLARSNRMAFSIKAPSLGRSIVIDEHSDYRLDDDDRWVAVEKYIRGVITEAGGTSRPNVHVKLTGSGKLIVAADQRALRDDEANRLYKKGTLRVKAQVHVVTGEMRNAELIEFVEYEPEFDEAEFKQLTLKGAAAWREVKNATEWVDDIRGG